MDRGWLQRDLRARGQPGNVLIVICDLRRAKRSGVECRVLTYSHTGGLQYACVAFWCVASGLRVF
jgi:hypothetical protein